MELKIYKCYLYILEVNNIMRDETIIFSLDSKNDPKKDLITVYNSLTEKEYDAINQIAGYILSGDPTYITTHNNARSLIQQYDRYELLKILIKFYLTN